MTVTLTDRIRAVLRHAERPLTAVQILAELPPSNNIDTVHALCGQRKRAGEFIAETVEGKLAYRLAPRQLQREEAPASTTAAVGVSDGAESDAVTATKPEVQKRRKPAPQRGSDDATQAMPTSAPQPSPEMQLVGFIRGASALIDETLEKAIHMSVNPAVLVQFARASKAMHSGALMLIGAP